MIQIKVPKNVFNIKVACEGMEDQVDTVSKEDVLKHLERGTAAIVDVLARHSYDELHIKGSISIPFDMVEDGRLDALGDQKSVITYCKNYTCLASKRAARLLKQMGFNASAYEGGIEEWEKSGLPVEGSNVGKT